MANDESKRDVMLMPARMQLAEHARQDWVATAEEGTLIEDVLNPQYWSHMASQMQPMDRIDVRIDTTEWLLELLVLQVGRNWARCAVLHRHDLAPVGDGDVVPSGFEVKWGGPVNKWRVIRLADREPLTSGHANREAAADWLRQYEKTIAATA